MARCPSILVAIFALVLLNACPKKDSAKAPVPPSADKLAPEAKAPAAAATISGIPTIAGPGTTIPESSVPAEKFPFIRVPLGLDTNLNVPASNPLTLEKIELGRLLYFDKRLSLDNTVSCASCHDPKKGWTDNEVTSTGVHGKVGARNSPTVINSTYNLVQFWDGRAKNLEEQALGPITNPLEMAHPSHDAMVAVLDVSPKYKPLFEKAFGDPKITKERVGDAIASFERTILGGNSRFDRWAAGDQKAMNEAEIRGRELFFGKANCTKCHVGANFTDSDFHNLGVGMAAAKPDLGRFDVTKDPKDKGAFKTPTIRDITKHSPYMHDGSQKTLEEVVEFYDKGGEKNPTLDFRVVPLNLTEQEKADLVAFMKALDSDPYPNVEEPKEFP